MRKYSLMAALAGTIFATAIAFNQADAMALRPPSGVLDAAATIEVAQLELVRWCGRRGCPSRYRYYGYYRPRPSCWIAFAYLNMVRPSMRWTSAS
jgi:hypothetical protein